MFIDGRKLIGLGGVPPHDNSRAYHWERRLHWVMVGVALLAVPAFYIEEISASPSLRLIAAFIDEFLFVAFAFELFWMLHVTTQKARYLKRNWLDAVIIASAAVSMFGWATEWVALARLMRLALVALLLTRALGSMRSIIGPHGLPYVLVFGVATLAVSGAGFYWLEPTVHSYGEGLWLAFVSGATIGYGDFVPTTPASRFFAAIVVVLSLAVMSVVTASIAAIFVGQDEKQLRRDMHYDIKQLRSEVERLIGDEEQALRREMHQDIRDLRREVARLRQDLEKHGIKAGSGHDDPDCRQAP